MHHRTAREAVEAFVTKDGSVIRELMHPSSSASRNQSLAEATVPPRGATTPHLHRSSEEIYHFTGGAGEMTLGAERFAVRAGDTVVVPPGTPHGLVNMGDAPLVLLCACAPPYAHDDTFLLDDEGCEARLRAWLDERKVAAEHLVFDRSCHSVADAAAAAGAPETSFVKSICMVAEDGRLVVAVVKGEDRANLERVAEALGLPDVPRLAKPHEMLARTLYPAGGTPPFGFDATFLVDERVLQTDVVLGGGGSARALVRLESCELARANGGRVVRVRR
jgi:Cys-tRNA(Pro)/Cys-tRNA(Cys) deacylase